MPRLVYNLFRTIYSPAWKTFLVSVCVQIAVLLGLYHAFYFSFIYIFSIKHFRIEISLVATVILAVLLGFVFVVFFLRNAVTRKLNDIFSVQDGNGRLIHQLPITRALKIVVVNMKLLANEKTQMFFAQIKNELYWLPAFKTSEMLEDDELRKAENMIIWSGSDLNARVLPWILRYGLTTTILCVGLIILGVMENKAFQVDAISSKNIHGLFGLASVFGMGAIVAGLDHFFGDVLDRSTLVLLGVLLIAVFCTVVSAVYTKWRMNERLRTKGDTSLHKTDLDGQNGSESVT